MAEGDGLDQNVAEGGAFRRSGDDGDLERVGGILIERGVLAAAADDVEALDFLAGEPFEFPQGVAVEQREAFVDAAHARADVGRHGLAGLAAKVGDLFRHVVRTQEPRVIGVDERDKGCGGDGELFEFGELHFLAGLGPVTARFLNEPEADDVLEQADGVAVADFIGETQRARKFGDDRIGRFDAHQRPGAGAQVGPVPAIGRNGGNRRTRVVRTRGDDFHGRQTDFGSEIGFHRAESGSAGTDGREQILAQAERGKQFLRPSLGERIVKLGGAGEGDLVARHAGTEKVERIADEQELLRLGEAFGRFGDDLVNGVERHELDASLGIDLRPRNLAVHDFHTPGSAGIAIAPDGRLRQAAFVIEHIVHAP